MSLKYLVTKEGVQLIKVVEETESYYEYQVLAAGYNFNKKYSKSRPDDFYTRIFSTQEDVIAYLIERARNQNKGLITISPIIKQGEEFKKILSFSYSYRNSTSNRVNNSVQTISNSVLTSGSWYRFYIQKSGIYKISKSFLQSLGFNVNVNPKNIKIFGNGGRMLPLDNSVSFPDDLVENAIQFVGEEEGVFDNNDYILFYAEGVS